MRFTNVRYFAGALCVLALILFSSQGAGSRAAGSNFPAPKFAMQSAGNAAQQLPPNPVTASPEPRFNVQDAAYNPRGTAGHGGCVTDATVTDGSGVVTSGSLAKAQYPPQVGW